jgi:Zn-dependent M28 family amino/carboxypeptidase
MMDKRIFGIVVILSALMTGTIVYKANLPIVTDAPESPISQPEPAAPTVEDALNTITAAQLKNSVKRLTTDFDGRRAGTQGNDLAAKFIGNTLVAAGLKVEYHQFQYGQQRTQNVYAWIDGKSDEVVVVGAHYDHLGKGFPGADDNASGTAAVMAVAKAYAALTQGKAVLDRTIVFQLYSGEEFGLYGSRFYCNYPIWPRGKSNLKKHVFMLNLDMVGHLREGYYRTDLEHDSVPALSTIVTNLSGKYSFASSITNRGSGGSDQQSFMNKGVPVAWLHTGMHANYHKPTDTPESLNYNGLEQISRYAFELVLAVVNNEKAMEFNRTNFQPLGYEYDHQMQPFLVP